MKLIAISAFMFSIASGEVVSLGAGSYSKTRPEGCAPLPEEIFRVDQLKGPVPTNQWWSSLVWERFSQNLFPHPLAMLCHKGGLAVTYPGAAIVAADNAIMGGGLDKRGDFVIGHSATDDFPDAKLAKSSAWFVTAEFQKGKAVMRLSFGHGSPFVFGEIAGGMAQLNFAEKPVVWSQKKSTLGIRVRGRNYGLFGSSGSTWKTTDDLLFENINGRGYFSVALLPDGEPATLARFQRYAHQHVVDTEVVSEVAGGEVRTRYSVTTKAKEGDGKGSIFALYPHQWKYLAGKAGSLSYQSVRGEMKLLDGESFETRVPVQGVLPMLPAEGIDNRERLRAYLEEESVKKKDGFGDTYWEGKHLGKLTTLSGIAEMMGEKKLQDRFVKEIQNRLENWFSTDGVEKEPFFYYNEKWGALIGCRPSYGSDSQLNDHHFHYGYFIRAAAEVARLDPQWARKWGPMVELLIRDIAAFESDEALFPKLRGFDLYAGHSWASGHAKFADGNNQESSSESMNAWYGMMLWGEATGRKDIRDLGVFLYNTERTAVEEYWFDVSGTNFPEAFPQEALGMVWGGKGAFATWFSADIDCIHGINWLPFTPASIYMGRHPDYVRRNFEMIVSKRKEGKDFNNGWGDLVVMFNALNDPDMAVSYLKAHPSCKLEGGNTHAFMDHWCHTLNKLGRNDSGVTADHPFTNVFVKDGKKSYAVYVFGDDGKTVTFSDGFKVEAKPGMTVKTPPK
ncbi:MAG: glycosyl hydrolase [Akkermansiaceae bacterium]|jgi:endoglucanase Acf2